ncbi:unnamed protein product [Brassica oleracea]
MASGSIKTELAVWRAGRVESKFGLPRVTVDGWTLVSPLLVSSFVS